MRVVDVTRESLDLVPMPTTGEAYVCAKHEGGRKGCGAIIVPATSVFWKRPYRELLMAFEKQLREDMKFVRPPAILFGAKLEETRPASVSHC